MTGSSHLPGMVEQPHRSSVLCTGPPNLVEVEGNLIAERNLSSVDGFERLLRVAVTS